MKVLVIEDDRETSAYVARGLREQGHVVDLAATGRDGLFLATEGRHDVVLRQPFHDAVLVGRGAV